MTVYVIALLNVHDQAAYAEYSVRARGSLLAYPEARLAADDAPVAIEGELPGRRVVLLQFADDREFTTWWESTGYRAAVPFRHESAETVFIAKVHGNFSGV